MIGSAASRGEGQGGVIHSFLSNDLPNLGMHHVPKLGASVSAQPVKRSTSGEKLRVSKLGT